jgi:hypothetical protein
MVHVGELGLQVRLVRSTHAGAPRVERLAVGLAELDVAGLGHEALDHPVKHDTVIGAFTGQFLDARDVSGRQIGQQLDSHGGLVWFP